MKQALLAMLLGAALVFAGMALAVRVNADEFDDQQGTPAVSDTISADSIDLLGIPTTPWVQILAVDPDKKDDPPALQCSGTYIGNGYVLSAGHCIDFDKPLNIYRVKGDNGFVYRTFTTALEVNGQGLHDLVIFKLEAFAEKAWVPAALDCKTELKVGDEVTAYGFPPSNDDTDVTFSRGYVNSSTRMPIPAITWSQPLVHTTLPVNHGSSGGPLLKDGKLVGIVVGIQMEQPAWSYAEPIKPVCNILEGINGSTNKN